MANKEPTHEPARTIYRRMKERGLSNRDLAGLIEVSPSTIGNLYANEVRPSPNTLKKLAVHLDLDAAMLLRLAGYLEDHPHDIYDPDVIELAQWVDSLPNGKRSAALAMLKGVRRLIEGGDFAAVEADIRQDLPDVMDVAESQESSEESETDTDEGDDNTPPPPGSDGDGDGDGQAPSSNE